MVHYSASVSLISMNTISKRKTSSKVPQAVEVEADIAKKEQEIEMQKEIYKQILGLKSEYKMEKQEMDGSVGEDQGNNDVVKDLSEQSEKMEVCQKLSGKVVSEHSKNTEHSQEQVEGRTFGSEKVYLNLTKCLDGSCSYLARDAKTNPIPEALQIIGNEQIEMSEVEYNTMRDTVLEEDTTSEDEFCDVDLSEFGIELSISESDVSYSSHQFLVLNESAASSHTSSQLSTTNDQDQISAQRNWKRTVLLMWKEIASHRFASLFLNPVSEERVPGYHSWVHRPMDLSNIKRNIRKGLIRTTVEFQRDIMLMFQNAVMYNSSDHDVYHKTVEMQRDVLEQIQDILEVVELGDYNKRYSGKSLYLMDK